MAAVLPLQHEVAEDVHPPRPGGLLVGAAAVPLGAAVLLTAGTLPWGSRAVLGLAVAALGAVVLQARGTASGARLGPGLPAGLGVVLVVAGAALTAAALLVGIADPGVGDAADGGPVPGWGAAAFWALVAVTGVVLLGLPRAGRATTRTAEGTVGIAAGLTIAALAGPGALGLGGGETTAFLLVIAVLGTAAAATARTAAGAPRIAALLAATVLAYLTGEATGLLALGTDGLLPATTEPVGDVARTVAQTAGLPLGAALLGLAFLRRDPLGGVLAAGLLLVPAASDGDPSVTVPVVVAAIGVLLCAVLVRSAPARDALGRVLRHTGPERSGAGAGVGPVRSTAALAGALAVLAVQVVGLGGEGADPGWVGPAVALLAVAGALAIAWAREDAAGTVAAMAGLAAVVVAPPVVAFILGVADPVPTERTAWISVAELAEAAVVAAIVLRHRHPMVLALAGIVVVGAVSDTVGVLAVDGEEPSPVAFLLAVLGVPALALLAVAGVAVLGPARRVRALQGLALGLAYLVIRTTASLPTVGQLLLAPDGGLDDGPRAFAVLLALLLPLGLALLAASTARRSSVAATAGVVLGTAAAAVYVGAVGVWTQVEAVAGQAPIRLTDPLVGFDAAGSALAGLEPGWPVMLGVLGAALLAAGWWLEGRRPAPVGR
jgi:hypothetical protein